MTKGLPDRKETLITSNVPAWEGDAMLIVLHDLGVNGMSRSPQSWDGKVSHGQWRKNLWFT